MIIAYSAVLCIQILVTGQQTFVTRPKGRIEFFIRQCVRSDQSCITKFLLVFEGENRPPSLFVSGIYHWLETVIYLGVGEQRRNIYPTLSKSTVVKHYQNRHIKFDYYNFCISLDNKIFDNYVSR